MSPKSDSVEEQDTYSIDNKSAFATLSSSRITLIKVSSISRGSRPEKADASTTFMEEEILSRKELKVLAMETDISTEAEKDLPKMFSQRIVATETTSVTQMRKTVVRSLRPKENVKCQQIAKICTVIPKTVSSLLLYLLILIIYAGMHVIMVVTAQNTLVHQFFLYSQLCGFFVFLMWEITGTITI